MRWQEARRLAEAAQYGADPETYREPSPDATTLAVAVVEAPGRFFVVFQPTPMATPEGIPRQIIPVIPHSGQYQVDRATGAVQWFQALPETPGTEDYWEGSLVFSHPLLGGEEE